MKAAFRADASIELGAGHGMRCLTLADLLRERGADTLFLCRPGPGHLGDLIQARGHALAWLPQQEPDAAASVAALAAGAPWDWLVVDHYGLGAGWQRAIRATARHILTIDDLANRAHACDLLLDQNLQEADRYDTLLPAACRRLLGPRYALLRPQFAAARQRQRVRSGVVRRLLVFFGGADASGETLKALEALAFLGRSKVAIDVVIGHANPHHVAIAAACATLPAALLHNQVEDMASLMAAADLFVGAGGGSAWERCCLGLPGLVLATADNQVAQSAMLARAGAQIYLGPAQSVDAARLAAALADLIDLPDLLIHLSQQGWGLVDGQGARRVADQLLATDFTLRRARPDDSAAIHAWRNHLDTRRFAFDGAEIDRETHTRWFERVLADPDRELLVAEREGQPLGVLRYDIEAGHALVSIYLVPGLAGQGWGVRLLLAGETWLRRERHEVVQCEAEVRSDNMVSSRAFLAAGYQPDRSIYKKDLHG